MDNYKTKSENDCHSVIAEFCMLYCLIIFWYYDAVRLEVSFFSGILCCSIFITEKKKIKGKIIVIKKRNSVDSDLGVIENYNHKEGTQYQPFSKN